MRDSYPVRSSISCSSMMPIPPRRTWPNASVVLVLGEQVAVLGRGALGDDDDRERAAALRGGGWMCSQTSSMSNGRSGIRITSAPPAMPE